MKLPQQLDGSSRIESWLNRLLAAIRPLRVVNSPDILVSRDANGTKLTVRAKTKTGGDGGLPVWL